MFHGVYMFSIFLNSRLTNESTESYSELNINILIIINVIQQHPLVAIFQFTVSSATRLIAFTLMTTVPI